ncbi:MULTISPECIES: hypothetical protein [unclassified Salinivibrio]
MRWRFAVNIHITNRGNAFSNSGFFLLRHF